MADPWTNQKEGKSSLNYHLFSDFPIVIAIAFEYCVLPLMLEYLEIIIFL